MLKTKVASYRITPELNNDLEAYKKLFRFSSVGEMLESFVKLLRRIDEAIDSLSGKPIDQWSEEEIQGILLPSGVPSIQAEMQTGLTTRRIETEFGKWGVKSIMERWEQVYSARKKKEEGGEIKA